MAFSVSLANNNIFADSMSLKRTYNSTAEIRTKVVTNRSLREKCTLYCSSTQNGTWVIYDVDEYGEANQIISIAVTGGTLSIYTHNHIAQNVFCSFTPSAAPGTENLTIRAFFGGAGIRS